MTAVLRGGQWLSGVVTLQSCKGLHYIISIMKACIYPSSSNQRASQPRPASGVSSPRQCSGPDLAGLESLGYKHPFPRGSQTEPQLSPGTAPLLSAACVRAVNRVSREEHGHPGKERSWGARESQGHRKADYLQLGNGNTRASNIRKRSWIISFPNHFGTPRVNSYPQPPTPIPRSQHISFPGCARANFLIFPLLRCSPMIKTGIQTLPPWRGFYHRFHTSVHLSHQAPWYFRRAGGEDPGEGRAPPGWRHFSLRSLNSSSGSRDHPCASPYTIIT